MIKACYYCGSNLATNKRSDALYCNDKCKDDMRYKIKKDKQYCNTSMDMNATGEYNANSIKIKNYTQWGWATAIALADEYEISAECIGRALRACEIFNVSTDWYVERYLKGNKGIPANKEVEDYLNQQMKDARWK